MIAWVAPVIVTTSSLWNDLVAYWRFDGNSTDATGYGHDGADTNITYVSNSIQSINGKGAQFTTATVSKITIANQISASWINTTPFTIATWVKSMQASSGFMCWYQGNNNGGFFTNKNDNTLNFQRGAPSMVCACNMGVWKHLVLSYSSSRFVFWIDGTKQTTTGDSGSAPGAAAAAQQMGGAYQDTGSMDEMGIWRRTLYDSEIATLYARTTSSFY